MDLMKALFGMYEKPSANNKVYLMKKLFNLKKAKGTPVVQHLNEFNTITNQLYLVEIEFDDEVCVLILLASLSNSWEAMRMVVSNSARKSKLKYVDIRDLILSEEIHRRNANIDNEEDQVFVTENKSRGRSREPNDKKFNVGHNQEIDPSSKKLENASIMRKMVTYKEIVGIRIKNKLKAKIKRIIVRNILQLL